LQLVSRSSSAGIYTISFDAMPMISVSIVKLSRKPK